MSSSKSTSSAQQRPKASTLPKPPTKLDPTCVIADSAILTGTFPITIGPQTILHPRATIISTYGPVTIDRGCIISEKAVVGLAKRDESGAKDEEISTSVAGSVHEIHLADDIILEPAAVVEGNVGLGSSIQAGAKVGSGAVVGKYCKIAPLCSLPPGEELPDFGIIYGRNQRRQERPGLEGLRKVVHDKELEVLRRLIPGNLAKWQTATATSAGTSGVS